MSASLEDLYSPSKWSKLPADMVILHHVDFVTKESQRVQREVPYERVTLENNIGFDIFGTDLPEDAPVFLYIHGGYWQELSKDLSSYTVAPLYKNNVKTIVVEYNLCPFVQMKDIIDEVKTIFKEALSYVPGAKEIVVAGHSAGAHLAISLLQNLTDKKPQGTKKIDHLFLISGVYDLEPLIHTTVNDALKMTEKDAKSLSPLFDDLETHSDLFVHVVVGEYDSPAFKKQSEVFCENLKNKNVSAEFSVIPDVDHFNIVEKLSEEDYQVTQDIIRALKN